MRGRLVAVGVVLALLVLGLVTAQASSLSLTTASLTAQENRGCAQSIAPLDVQADEGGDGGIVIRGLPASCDGLPLRVELASADEGTVFAGAGTAASGTTTLAGTTRQEPLVSSVDRAVTVIVGGWPLPAQWLPAAEPPAPRAPIYSVDPARWAVRDISWTITTATIFCVSFSVENLTGAPVSWEVAADLSTPPFNGGSTMPYNPGWPTRADRIVGDVLYLTQDSALAPFQSTGVTLCDYNAPYPAVREPGPSTYTVQVGLEVERIEGQRVVAACARVTVRDTRLDEQFWVGWYADVDWAATLAAAVRSGSITSSDAAHLGGRPLNWQRSGSYGGTLLDSARQLYRVQGTGWGTRAIGPGGVLELLGCTG